jgi:hypothetical protein
MMENLLLAEHLDHQMGEASDLKNAYCVSQMERPFDDRAAAEELVSLGRYVVVREHVTYCPRTDASMGTVMSMLDDFENHDEALELARKEEMNDGECWVHILSPKTIILNPLIFQEEEIPF